MTHLPSLVARLADSGCRPVDDQPLAGYERFGVDDPFGNRIELMQPAAARAAVGES